MRSRVHRATDLVAKLLGRHGVARELREHRLLSRWPEIVGERVAARAWPDGLSKGVLWVRVANAAWLHELSFLRDQIIVRANQIVGDPPVVRDVQFHQDPARRADADDALAPTLRIRRPAPRLRPLPPPATGARLAAIEREAAGIEDDELRSIIVDARRKLDL